MLTDSYTSIVAFTSFVTVVLALGILAKPSFARQVVGALVFVASIAPAYDYSGIPHVTWLFPLQEYRSTAYFGLALGLLIGTLPNVPRVSITRAGPQALILLMIGLYQGVLRIYHDTLDVGLGTLAFSALTTGSLLLLMPTLIAATGWLRLLRAIMAANALWLLAVLVQLALHYNALMVGSRFAGLTSNPQSAAIFLSMSALIAFWMVLHEQAQRYRGIWLITLCMDLVLLLWTGSRLGAITLVLGMLVLLRHHMARRVFILLLAGSAVYLGYLLLDAYEISAAVEHLSYLGDSGRVASLTTMWHAGLEHPGFGAGIDVGASENSYLLAFGAFGVGMVALTIALLIVTVAGCVSLVRSRTRKGRTLADLVLAFNVMYVTVSMFEGIMLSRVRDTLVLMIAFSACSARLRRPATRATVGVRRPERPSRRPRVGEAVRVRPSLLRPALTR